MSIEVIQHKELRARKEYDCQASDYLKEGLQYVKGEISFSDLRIISKIQAENHKILKGQKYIKQFNKQDGLIYNWIARKDSYDLCVKYNLFDSF